MMETIADEKTCRKNLTKISTIVLMFLFGVMIETEFTVRNK